MKDLARSSLLSRKYETTHLPRSSKPDAEQQQQQRYFRNFSKLPIDLRLLIWRLIAPTPQEIGVLPDMSCLYRLYYPREKGQVPAVLHVNQESRTFALESYTAEDSISGSSAPFRTSASDTRIYLSWKRDTIFPMYISAFHSFQQPDIFENPHIRNIALNVRDLLESLDSVRSDGCLKIPSLLGMPNLEEITFYYSFERRLVPKESLREIDESVFVRDLCRMPGGARSSMSYLLAARKTVYKEFNILKEKLNTWDELVRRQENVPKGLSDIKERLVGRKRPVVKLAYLLSSRGKSHNIGEIYSERALAIVASVSDPRFYE